MSDWIEWTGGENPVPGKVVNVRQRHYLADDEGKWQSDEQDWSHAFDNREARASDIIAYRLASPPADQPDEHIVDINDMVDLAELKRLAEAATPGPWDEVHNMAGPMMVKGGKDRSYVCHLAMNRHEHDNAAFITAANPATVLSLLDLIARQQETIRADGEALRPFARYLDVLETMGGNTPRTGTYCGVTGRGMEAEITIEDMQEARARLSARQGGGS